MGCGLLVWGLQPRRGDILVARGATPGKVCPHLNGFRPVRADIKRQPGMFTRRAQAPDLDVFPSSLIGVSDSFRY